MPIATASARLAASIFSRIAATWNLAVWSEMFSLPAISLLAKPSASRRSTSISRGVSACRGLPEKGTRSKAPRLPKVARSMTIKLAAAAITAAVSSAGPQSRGHKGATLAYRKIQDLELDPLFCAFLTRPLFLEICARIYGDHTPIALFRAMFMNKPAHQGTFLPWHQDRWSALDRDPLVTVWTALDPATRDNGCVQLIPGSHREAAE